jgi:hypothetical protein
MQTFVDLAKNSGKKTTTMKNPEAILKKCVEEITSQERYEIVENEQNAALGGLLQVTTQVLKKVDKSNLDVDIEDLF